MKNGILKTTVTKTVSCEICGSKIKREKTFKITVSEDKVDQAKTGLTEKAKNWKLTEKQKHCHICWSIVK